MSAKSRDWTEHSQNTRVSGWRQSRRKTPSRLEETRENVPPLNADDGEKQPAWADLLHGSNVVCDLTDPSNVLEDRVRQLETQVIWKENTHSAVPCRANIVH